MFFGTPISKTMGAQIWIFRPGKARTQNQPSPPHTSSPRQQRQSQILRRRRPAPRSLLKRRVPPVQRTLRLLPLQTPVGAFRPRPSGSEDRDLGRAPYPLPPPTLKYPPPTPWAPFFLLQELPCAKSAQACRTLHRPVPVLRPAPRAQSTSNPLYSSQFPANLCAPHYKLSRTQFSLNCANPHEHG